MCTASGGSGGPCSPPLHPTHCHTFLGYSHPVPPCPNPSRSRLLDSPGGKPSPSAQDPPCTPLRPPAALCPLRIPVPIFPSRHSSRRGYPRTPFAALLAGWLRSGGAPSPAGGADPGHLLEAAAPACRGWWPHHECISRRVQPFIPGLINAWTDPDFCKYILLYVLNWQGRGFEAC